MPSKFMLDDSIGTATETGGCLMYRVTLISCAVSFTNGGKIF